MTPLYIYAAALILAGWLVVFLSLRRMLKRTNADFRLEFDRRMETLSAKLRNLEDAASARTTPVTPAQKEASGSNVTRTPAPSGSEEITPETVAKIGDTITALLGRKVQIRSVKILETPETVSTRWAQQGRAVIQASRNFASRRRE